MLVWLSRIRTGATWALIGVCTAILPLATLYAFLLQDAAISPDGHVDAAFRLVGQSLLWAIPSLIGLATLATATECVLATRQDSRRNSRSDPA